MAINTKAIKTRINSVKNTKKITRAMQMIAAVKMQKAVEAALKTREYAQTALDLMGELGSVKTQNKLMMRNKSDKQLWIVVTSNRGLCGNYNNAVLKEAEVQLRIKSSPSAVDVVAIGKKAAQFAKRNNLNLVALYEKLGDRPDTEDLKPIASEVIASYEKKIYSKVIVIYTNYISGLNQEVITRQLLPITRKNVEETLEDLAVEGYEPNSPQHPAHHKAHGYILEPDKEEILNYLLPMLLEVQLLQAVLESAASEHSSRMIAMKNATESANEMVQNLTLEFNKGRQAAITQEIAEISAGADAL